jgi:predicted dehydrogenase
MNKVKLGLIGMGGMGGAYFKMLKEIAEAELTCVCDRNPAAMEPFQGPKFTDHKELLKSGLAEAVMVVTPHFAHTPIAVDALSAGIHVLVDKPVAVHVNDAKKMVAAHKDPAVKFAAMFNMRTNPLYAKLKQLVEKGELGEIRRVNWIMTEWFRSDYYYSTAGWRATWKGEGGGVLLNQCPHNLDLLQWITGMPARITAFINLGKYHPIEVEDDVNAFLEYGNGATGVFITTTGEAPGTNRFEITGDRGKIVAEGGKLRFTRNEVPASEFCKTTKTSFNKPPVWEIDIPVATETGPQHAAIIRNFCKAIKENEPLVAPAEEGLRSLELANAMVLSGMTKKAVDLPMDADAYEAMLNRLIAESEQKKRGK